MSNLNKEFHPKKRQDLLFRELDDGGAVYNPETEELHTLNNTAAYIWCLCTGDFSVKEIVVQIKQDFDNQENEKLIEQEVKDTINKFIKLDLLIEG